MAESLLDQTTTVEVVNPTFRTVVQEDGLDKLGKYLAEEGLADSRAFVITDDNVDELYGDAIHWALLDEAGIDSSTMIMSAGEEHKTLEQAGKFIEQLSMHNATRGDTIIAFGGGVVGDLGGFVASIYNRGVSLVQVPTTLLAMVDSSIGGKTGVDHGGKNKTGSFYQPKLVVADPTLLSTLDARVYTEGFGEVAKYAILDADLLPELEDQAETLRTFSMDNLGTLGALVARSVKQKSDVIAADPHEKAPDGRVLLNYGHTLGHGLEAAGNYTELLHGEAVSIGMNYAAQLAMRLGYTDQAFVDRQTKLLEALGLPTVYEGQASLDHIIKHMAKDKKNTGADNTRFVLPQAAGHMIVEKIDNSIVRETVEEFLAA